MKRVSTDVHAEEVERWRMKPIHLRRISNMDGSTKNSREYT